MSLEALLKARPKNRGNVLAKTINELQECLKCYFLLVKIQEKAKVNFF